jgi:hypothetical protein
MACIGLDEVLRVRPGSALAAACVAGERREVDRFDPARHAQRVMWTSRPRNRAAMRAG